MQILKVEIAGYISLSNTMSLRDELVENERLRGVRPFDWRPARRPTL